jgi:hypothetical protein
MKTIRCDDKPAVAKEPEWLTPGQALSQEGVYQLKGNSTIYHICVGTGNHRAVLTFDTETGILDKSYYSEDTPASTKRFKKINASVCFDLKTI